MQKIKNSKRLLPIALAVAGVAGLMPSTARADLSMTGATGLTINPTAEIPERGQVRLQAGYAILGSNFGGEFSIYGVRAAARLRDVPLEMSGGVLQLDVREEFSPGATGNLERAGIDLGVKYLLTGEPAPGNVSVAVGAGQSRAFFQNRHVYAVASTPVRHFLNRRPPLNAHLGVRQDRYRSNIETSRRASIYGGLEIPLDRRGTYTFTGELQSKNHRFNVVAPRTDLLYSYALRYHPQGKSYYTSFGIQRQGVLSDSSLFAYAGYDF